MAMMLLVMMTTRSDDERDDDDDDDNDEDDDDDNNLHVLCQTNEFVTIHIVDFLRITAKTTICALQCVRVCDYKVWCDPTLLAVSNCVVLFHMSRTMNVSAQQL